MRPKVKKVWRVKFMTNAGNKKGITGELYLPTKNEATGLAELLMDKNCSVRADAATIDRLPIAVSVPQAPASWVKRMIKRFS